jgi:hypothetical protein
MSESKQLEQAVEELIVDLCAVLYEHGYQEVSVGALMRVIGVDAQEATKHDQEIINLTQQFSDPSSAPLTAIVPAGTTFH